MAGERNSGTSEAARDVGRPRTIGTEGTDVNLLPSGEMLRERLASWGIRGVFCAAPSFVWAVFAAVRTPLEILAMVAGILTYVLAFAWATSIPVYVERMESHDLGVMLRWAANARAALAPLMVFGPDAWMGFASLTVVQMGATFAGFSPQSRPEGALFVYVTTLVQGALVSATIVLLTLLFWGVRVGWREWRRLSGSVRRA